MIDELFEDCEQIADKYETNLLCVLDRYTTIEMQYKRQMTKVKHEIIIKETENYFKTKLEKST